jgi:hypothetical protein
MAGGRDARAPRATLRTATCRREFRSGGLWTNRTYGRARASHSTRHSWLQEAGPLDTGLPREAGLPRKTGLSRETRLAGLAGPARLIDALPLLHPLLHLSEHEGVVLQIVNKLPLVVLIAGVVQLDRAGRTRAGHPGDLGANGCTAQNALAHSARNARARAASKAGRPARRCDGRRHNSATLRTGHRSGLRQASGPAAKARLPAIEARPATET